MNQKVELGPKQKKWVETLKSGSYKQNQDGLLRTANDEFCCLGVAIDLFTPEDWNKRYVEGDGYSDEYWTAGNEWDMAMMKLIGETEVATDKIVKTLKLKSATGRFTEFSESVHPDAEYFIYGLEIPETSKRQILLNPELASMNDNGVSFEKIAEFIEKFPEHVFKGKA